MSSSVVAAGSFALSLEEPSEDVTDVADPGDMDRGRSCCHVVFRERSNGNLRPLSAFNARVSVDADFLRDLVCRPR